MTWKPICVGVAIGLFFAFQLMLFFFSFFPASANLIDQAVVSYAKDVIGPIFTGLGGAMLGAFAAVYFQRASEASKEFNDSVRVLRLVKLELIQKLGELTSIKKYSVLPHEKDKCRFMTVGPLPEKPGINASVNNKILDLLASERAGKAIENVMLGDQRYFACFENFRERNKALAIFRDKINSSDLAEQLHYNFDQMLNSVEPGRVMALYRNTEDMLSILDESIQTLDDALAGVASALDKTYTVKGTTNFTLEKKDPRLFEPIAPPHFTVESLQDRIFTKFQRRDG